MSPVRSHFAIPAGRSPVWTDTLAAVGADVPGLPPQAATTVTSRAATRILGIRLRLAAGPGSDSRLGKDRPAPWPELVDGRLDPFPHLLADLEHEASVAYGLGPVLGDLDRLAEGDEPLRGQREQPGQTEPRERRGDREVRQAEQPGYGLQVGEHRVHLLRADDSDRDDGRARAQRDLDEASAAEAADPVAVAVALGRALDALREHADQLVAFEERGRVVGMREHVARLDQEHV